MTQRLTLNEVGVAPEESDDTLLLLVCSACGCQGIERPLRKDANGYYTNRCVVCGQEGAEDEPFRVGWDESD